MEEQTTPQQSLKSYPHNYKSKNILIVLIVLTLISSAIAGYTVYKNNQLKKQIRNLEAANQQPTPTQIQENLKEKRVEATFDTNKGTINLSFLLPKHEKFYKFTEKIFENDEFNGQRYIIDQSPIREHYIEYWPSSEDLINSISYEQDGDEMNPGRGCFVSNKPRWFSGIMFYKEICYYNPPPGSDSPKEYSKSSSILHEHCIHILDNDNGALYFWSVAEFGHDTCETLRNNFKDLEISVKTL